MSVLFIFLNQSEYAVKVPLTRADRNTSYYIFDCPVPSLEFPQNLVGVCCIGRTRRGLFPLNQHCLSNLIYSVGKLLPPSLVNEGRRILSHWLFPRPRRILIINTFSHSFALFPFWMGFHGLLKITTISKIPERAVSRTITN